MNSYVIDSSGWLEFFSGSAKAKVYRKYILSHQSLITPTLILYEVYKKIVREKSASEGILAVTQIQAQSKHVVPLNEKLSLFAADVSLKWKLAMADSIIYATTLQEDATLVTSDHHFEGLKQVILI